MRYRYESAGNLFQISLDRHGDVYQADVEGQPFHFEILDFQPEELSILFEGKPITLYWASDGDRKWISFGGCTYLLERPSPGRSRAGELSAESTVRAPMPAQVRAVLVLEGDTVEKGESLLLLEAMKMEIRVQAPLDGRVEKVFVEEGQPVNRDQVLVKIV